MNKGERGELLIKLRLIEMRDNGIIPSFLNEPINQLGFGEVIYASFPEGTDLSIIKKCDVDIVKFCNIVGIVKAPANYKSDVYINNKGYSLKSLSDAPPALVNHTTRPGFETACTHAKSSILSLDNMIDTYWTLRNSGTISEDVGNINPNSPFACSLDYMRPILNYFLFSGTGSGLSPFPAEYILEYLNPFLDSTWQRYDKITALNSMWEKLVFSVRATKGMPKNYDVHIYDRVGAESIKIWVRYSSGKYRGALHIRAKK